MLHLLRDVKGLAVTACDEEVGRVRDVLFDEATFGIRYFVVRTGWWLSASEILIIPAAVKNVSMESGTLVTMLDKKQIGESPPLTSNPPISRQYEEILHRHYEWSPYWGAALDPFYGIIPPSPRIAWHSLSEETRKSMEKLRNGDSRLESALEVDGYKLACLEGDFGHICDFLADEVSWRMKYLVVKAGNWLLGRKVVIDCALVQDIEWLDSTVHVSLSRKDLEKSPSYDPRVVDAAYERALSAENQKIVESWGKVQSQELARGGNKTSRDGGGNSPRPPQWRTRNGSFERNII